ncbi:hypothetical protein IR120_11160 [Muribacter muris]|uniref:hypothetical protein n=1 Tax=Muribacter muris TaxID=67855 RepID=UPI00142F4DDB|nr:hypothetical protein [Muribacter muris]MBF0786014.1 hypothetical protein [Muribacter muris]MBF0826782.1 hypothetical protein [Muribacter muris]
MKNKTTLTQSEIKQLNQDLADDGIIYDLNINNIDILSFDNELIEVKENGEEKRS